MVNILYISCNDEYLLYISNVDYIAKILRIDNICIQSKTSCDKKIFDQIYCNYLLQTILTEQHKVND